MAAPPMEGPPLPENPLLGPALAPPQGVMPVYAISKDYQWITIADVIVILTLTTTTTFIRFLLKTTGKNNKLEDYLMYVAWALTIVYAGVGIKSSQLGGGTHQWNLLLGQLLRVTPYLVVGEVIYAPIIVFAKVSILVQIQRIFVVSKQSARFWIVQFLIFINIAFYVAIFFAVIFQCSPVKRTFHREIPGTCINNAALLVVVAVWAVVSDFAILLLPVLWVWKLQVSSSKRIGVAAIFSVALVGCGTSILRLYYSVANYSTTDISYGFFQIGLASSGEFCAAILAGNMVVIPRAVTRAKVLTTSLRSSFKQSLLSRSGGTTSASRNKSAWMRSGDAERLTENSVELSHSAYVRSGNKGNPYKTAEDGRIRKEQSFTLESKPQRY